MENNGGRLLDKLILKERETKEKIVQIINESELPAFILKPIFKDILEQINQIEMEQYNLAISNKTKAENLEKGEKND